MSINLSRKHSGPSAVLQAAALASAAGRIAIGAGLFAAPRLALRGLGFKDASRTTVTVAQIAGGRDLVMGIELVLALRAGDEERLRRAVIAGAACDAGDALAFSGALAAGDAEAKAAGKRGLPMAALAALGGFAASRT